MPYTPPSHRSPASSTASSPDASRRASFQSGSRPSLPRSASYLSKHRRTSSISALDDAPSTALPTLHLPASISLENSVRQSPSPPNDESAVMPRGAIISPPESVSSGSDDEDTAETRARRIDAIKDLRDVVNQISKSQAASNSCSTTSSENSDGTLELLPEAAQSCAVIYSEDGDEPKAPARSARRVGHARSLTEPNVPADSSLTVSEDSDEDWRYKPQMVRKKSGELVRPALRVSHRRPSSMPGTPILSKAVHFDSHLEHVRHFLQVDRPLAVSAGSSPVEAYEGETEFPFMVGAGANVPPISLSPPFEWELVMNNTLLDTQARRYMPVRLERVWLSTDQKCLHGSVDVSNLAFHKQVFCRFTLDYWKTVSEINASYSSAISPQQGPLGHDRFNFTIKLSDMANLESKTLFFCIRYSVDGNQFWDNNNAANFQVDFKKKHLPQNGKNNFQSASTRTRVGLPRSNRRQSQVAVSRPASVPSSLDTFGENANRLRMEHKINDCLDESGPSLRLKNESSRNLAADNLAQDLSTPSGSAFSNRYDFGASLNAAMQAGKEKDKDGDALYMKKNVRGFNILPAAAGKDSPPTSDKTGFRESSSPGGGLPSTASYEELVNKYCFFGSKPPKPAVGDKVLTKSRFDGSDCHDGATGSEVRYQPALSVSAHLAGQGACSQQAGSTASLYLDSGASSTCAMDGDATCNIKTPSVSFTTSSASAITSMATTQSSDGGFMAQSDRFPWTSETQTATAIRG